MRSQSKRLNSPFAHDATATAAFFGRLKSRAPCPAKLRVSRQISAAPSTIVVWAVVAAGVHDLVGFGRAEKRIFSGIGRRPVGRRPMLPPLRLPRITPTRPVFANAGVHLVDAKRPSAARPPAPRCAAPDRKLGLAWMSRRMATRSSTNTRVGHSVS